MDEAAAMTYLRRSMRFLLALVALLSGLTVPQAVNAAATGRVDSSVVASQSVGLAPMRRDCAVACVKSQPPAGTVARRPIWLPTVALAPVPAIRFGDRARE